MSQNIFQHIANCCTKSLFVEIAGTKFWVICLAICSLISSTILSSIFSLILSQWHWYVRTFQELEDIGIHISSGRSCIMFYWVAYFSEICNFKQFSEIVKKVFKINICKNLHRVLELASQILVDCCMSLCTVGYSSNCSSSNPSPRQRRPDSEEEVSPRWSRSKVQLLRRFLYPALLCSFCCKAG